jgi:hypothetical protein
MTPPCETGGTPAVGTPPWWSTLAIAFDVLAIYAITGHGERLRANR